MSDDDIFYYGLSLSELLALSILFYGVRTIRNVLLEYDACEHVDSDFTSSEPA